jgi:hypothetical protein
MLKLLTLFGSGGRPAPAVSLNLLAGVIPSTATFGRSSTAAYYNSSGVLSFASSGVPRFDYNPLTLQPVGLLMEQSSTNKCDNSQAIGNASWANNNVTAALNNAVAPDGTTTATQLTVSGTSQPYSYANTTYTASGTYTVSLFVKQGTATTAVLGITDNSANAAQAIFTFATKTFTPSTAGNGSVAATSYKQLLNGWFRLQATIAFSGTTAAQSFIAGVTSGTGTVSQTVYVWGAQYEALPFATSYIPTTSVNVTRSADSLIISSIPWYNSAAGTVFARAVLLGASTTSNGLASIDDNSGNNGLELCPSFYGSDNGFIRNAGVTTFQQYVASPAVGTTLKLALAYSTAASAARFYENGTAGSVTTAFTAGPGTVTQAQLGYSPNAGSQLNGWLQNFSYWRSALTAAQLKQLTTS